MVQAIIRLQGKIMIPDVSLFIKLPVLRTTGRFRVTAAVRRKVLFMSKNKNNFNDKNNSSSQNKNSNNGASDKNSSNNYQDRNSNSNSND